MAPARDFEVTSSHHQAVRDVPPPFRVSAVGPDGVIEAIEDPSRPFCIGVQWHPERHPTHPDWLLQAFVRHCAGRLEATVAR
jgi:putative glutamine amidotransferase